MKMTVSEYDFNDAFENMRPDNFSYEGRRALYDYLTEYEEDTGDEIELDVIGLCCEYTEYDNIAEYNENYNTGHESREEIDETIMISVGDDGFVIQSY